MTSSFMKEFEHLKIQLEEIKTATNSFSSRVIGKGGFGAVYEGEVSHSKGRRSIVAIKRLNRQFGQGDAEFLKEITLLSRCTHQNLISLLGFCDEEGEKVLVYEFASKGSLDRHLSDPDLTWVERIKICLGAAKGLCYLHDPKGRHQRVLHCDIKSANILLDENLTAKVADFGLSKMGPANQQYSVLVTNALGTAGYCDPLFMMTYTLTKESDVYSFGVVLFEVLCGRLCYEYNNGQGMVFVNLWKKKFLENKLNEIVFQHLEPQMDPTSLELFSDVAFQCLHNSREDRPTMSIVVEKLEEALEFQELYDHRQKLPLPPSLPLPEGYKEILNVAVPPLRFTSIDELNELFSKGVFLNAGKTWFSRNGHAEHYVMISLAECLIQIEGTGWQYRTRSDSRFEVGSYLTYDSAFKICAKTQFLSPLIIYRVNLVFKLTRSESYKHEYLPLRYTLNGEKKVLIVYLANKRKDEWLKAGLHQFTSDEKMVDLEIYFDRHRHCDGLEREGIEFQPLEKWFSRNDKGVNYVFKSIQECFIQGDYYKPEYNYSRFLVDSYVAYSCRFKACVKTEFLSPLVTYTVNLVFKLKYEYENDTAAKQKIIWLNYELEGTYNHVSHLAYKREDNWWTVELCHYTSDGTTVDLEITFEGSCQYYLTLDGIEFQPLEKVELQVSQDDQKHVNLEPTLSDSEDNTYWEKKLPTNYKDIIKFSEQGLRWTNNKELYYILSQGLFINYKPYVSFFQRTRSQQWFCLDKNGKTCLMLPAREVCRFKTPNHFEGKSRLELNKWNSLPESRFGEGLVGSISNKNIFIKENKFRVLSPQTQYACYLIYKTERGGCTSPVLVWHKDWGSKKWEYGSHIYLVSPQTPVIRPKAGENTHNPLYRPKLKGIPQQRSDGWMEVQVWEFKTDTTKTVIPSLHLVYRSMSYYRKEYLEGLTIIGIEFRPI